jgi:phage baseplate assembly protein gpV
VVFPSAGGYALTFPVKQGDECLLIFCERSYDNWYENGDVQPPSARRFHALSDAVAIVGLHSKNTAVESYADDAVQLRNSDATAGISIDDAQDITIETATGSVTCAADGGTITLRAPQVIVQGQLVCDGNFTCSGTMLNDGVNVGKTHIHPQGPDSDGDVQVPTGPPQ